MTVTLVLVQVLRHLQDKASMRRGGPPSLSDRGPPAWWQLPSQQSSALQPCCARTPSLLPASDHKVRVIFARCLHRKSLQEVIKQDPFLELSFPCTCLLSCDSKGVAGFCLACRYPTQIPTTYRVVCKSWPAFLSLLLCFVRLLLGLDWNHDKPSDFKRVFSLVVCFA